MPPVVSFTTALFLSGYAIQQRTVRNLRAAIRPDTSPQLYLPDRFRDATTELADGTIVMLDEYNRPVRLKAGRISLGKPADAAARLDHHHHGEAGPGGQETVQITVHETVAEDLPRQEQKVVGGSTEPAAVAQEMIRMAERDGAAAPASPPQPRDPDPEPEPVQQPPPPQLAPWEVRGEDAGGAAEAESPDEDRAKPLGRAERRRQIKEDIQKLAQGETPLYYQRRLW